MKPIGYHEKISMQSDIEQHKMGWLSPLEYRTANPFGTLPVPSIDRIKESDRISTDTD